MAYNELLAQRIRVILDEYEGITQQKMIYQTAFGSYCVEKYGATIIAAFFQDSDSDEANQSENRALLDFTTSELSPQGTPFERMVWDMLLKIPYGHTMSYEEVAQALDKPRAVRAVAHAIAKNPIAYLIPCHRVMYKNGRIGAYRWGAARKKALLAWEAASSSE